MRISCKVDDLPLFPAISFENIATPPPYEEKDHLWYNGIYAEADTAITGNVIEGAKNFGLMLGWGAICAMW